MNPGIWRSHHQLSRRPRYGLTGRKYVVIAAGTMIAALAATWMLDLLHFRHEAMPPEKAQSLFAAVETGDIDTATRIMAERRWDLNAPRHKDGNSFLHEAIACGQHAMVKELLSRGCDPDVTNGAGLTPLCEAVSFSRNLATVKLLLAAGAAPDPYGKHEQTPLIDAAARDRTDIVVALLDAGAPADSCADSLTPLESAASVGAIHAAKVLVARGANVNGCGKELETPPLACAVTLPDMALASWLIEKGAVVDTRYGLGQTPLFNAVLSRNHKAVKLLLEKRADPNAVDDSGSSALHVAAGLGLLKMARMLVDARSDVNKADKRGWTPLHVAARESRIDIVRLLLEHGASTGIPICDAASRGNAGQVATIVDTHAGAIDQKDVMGWVPLHWAAMMGKAEVARQLIEKGCLLDVADSHGNTPLHLAASSGGAEVTAILLKEGAKCDVRNSRGNTPLHRALAQGNIEVARILIVNGADMDIMNRGGVSPRQWIRKSDDSNIRSLLNLQAASRPGD